MVVVDVEVVKVDKAAVRVVDYRSLLCWRSGGCGQSGILGSADQMWRGKVDGRPFLSFS